MKKFSSQTLKVVAATVIASSAYVAVTPAQADAAVPVAEIVQQASSHIPTLRQVSSIEYGANVRIRQPYNEYNRAKADYNTALAAVNRLPHGNQKIVLSEKLNDVKVLLNRMGLFIDALTSGKKLKSYTDDLNHWLKIGNIPWAVESYHKLSREINKQAVILYRVYGKSTRDEILRYYKQPAEEAKANALYPVSVEIEIGRLYAALEDENREEIQKRRNNIEHWLEKIPEEHLNAQLQDLYDYHINHYINEIDKIVPYEDAFILKEDSGFSLPAIFIVHFKDGTEFSLIDRKDVNEHFTFKDNKGYFKADGTFTDAYAETGLLKSETVEVDVFDKKTGELLHQLQLEVRN